MDREERQVNRLTIQFLADLNGVAQSFEDVLNHVQGRFQTPCRHLVKRAITTLVTARYVDIVGPTADEALYIITDKGFRQATRTVKRGELDPLIWEDPA